MKENRTVERSVIVIGALILLAGIGAYWPHWVGAATPQQERSPSAIVNDWISYQGFVSDIEGNPLSGQFAMSFEIYNDAQAGDLLWGSGVLQIQVNEGLFSTEFGIAADIFNGEELWVAQTVEGELLEPRQAILPVPLAHGLRPGAVVKGTASAIPNNYIFEANLNNDAFAFNRGAITGQTTTGNAIYGLANSGRAIYGQTQDGYAVYGFDGGSNANEGYGGFFYSTNGIGVYGYSNGNRAHPNIYAPGVYGESNRGVGVYGRGDVSDSFTFYNEGGYFEGGRGLYALGTDPADEFGYGARIYSNNYRGAFIRGGNGHFDAYFGSTGGINVDHVVERNPSTTVVANGGSETIRPGDLLAMAGVVTSPMTGEPMLAVEKLGRDNLAAVIGVAAEAIELAEVVDERDARWMEFARGDGPISPGSYLTLQTDGLAASVNLSDWSRQESLRAEGVWEIGDRVVLSAEGVSRAAGESGGVRIGRVAGPVDEAAGTVPIFIDID